MSDISSRQPVHSGAGWRGASVVLALRVALLLACSQAALAQAPPWRLAMATGAGNGAYGSGLALDGDGGTCVAITFSDTLRLGSWSRVSAGETDLVIVNLDRSGSVVWSNGSGGSGPERGVGLSRGTDGSLFTAMNFRGVARLGDSSFESRGAWGDVAVARYSSGGALMWARVLASGGRHNVVSLAAATDGGCIVIGQFQDSMTIGQFRLSGIGEGDIFVARLDAAGTAVWARAIGGMGTDNVTDLATNPSGRIALVGTFQAALQFGEFSITTTYPRGNDMFIAVLDGGGVPLGLRKEGGIGDEQPDGVAISTDGALYMVGMYSASNRIGDRDLPVPASVGAFLVAYDPDLTPRWVQPVLGEYSCDFKDVCVNPGRDLDGDGGIYVTGGFGGRLQFGETVSIAAGGIDLLVARFDPDGRSWWAQTGGGAASDAGLMVRSDGDGSCRVVGHVERGLPTGAAFGPFTLYPETSGSVCIGWLDDMAHVAVADFMADDGITLAPNPSSGFAMLSLNAACAGPARVELIDPLGRLRAVPFDGRVESVGVSIEIRTGVLTDGVYFCRVAAGESVHVLPLVVRR